MVKVCESRPKVGCGGQRLHVGVSQRGIDVGLVACFGFCDRQAQLVVPFCCNAFPKDF